MTQARSFDAKPQQQYGFENAVALVANTPIANPPKVAAAVLVSCTTAGNIVLVTSGGQTITVAVPIGVFVIPVAVTQMNTSTFVGTAFGLY